jgi:biopolymer transport protein TolR
MARKRSKSAPLICMIDVTSFGVVMATAIITSMATLTMYPVSFHGSSMDLPRAHHAVSMPHANREDALVITITRDGKVFLGVNRVPVKKMSANIRIRVINGAERKVFLKVDGRAMYRDVEMVVDEVRSAGVENIVFLVESVPTAVSLGK